MRQLGHLAWISVEALAELLGCEDLLLIDTRGVDFVRAHIPGSRHCDLDHFSSEVCQLAGEVATQAGKTVVFVDMLGGGYAMTCALDFLRKLRKSCSYSSCKVNVLQGGFKAWEGQFAGHRESARYIANGAAQGDTSPVCTPPPSTGSSGSSSAARSIGSSLQECICAAASRELGRPRSMDGVAPVEDPDRKEGESRAFLDSLAFGDLVWVRSGSLGTWVQACIVAIGLDTVKVQYMIRGNCCVKGLPRNSTFLKGECPDA